MPLPRKNQRLSHKSARDRIGDELSTWIMNRTLEPGEKLNEAEIAEYFSVSRTPVREALQVLMEHHLVDMIPNKGCYVTLIRKEDMQMLYEALAAVNGYLAILACRKRSDEDLAELEKYSYDFKNGVEKGILQELPELDARFHEKIADISQNMYLKDYLRSLSVQAYRYEFAFFNQSTDRSESVRGHEKLIEAIRSRDENKAFDIGVSNWTQTLRIV